MQIIFGFMQPILSLVPNFACVATSLNEKLIVGQRQIIEGPTDDEITSMQTLKSESSGTAGWGSHVHKAQVLLTQMLATTG